LGPLNEPAGLYFSSLWLGHIPPWLGQRVQKFFCLGRIGNGFHTHIAVLVLWCLPQVKPLSWPLHTHRKVFSAALESAATDSELQAAAVAAREEFARSGRAASFSSKHLARQATLGGTTRHELLPGPMGPKTQAATEAAASMACEAVGSSGADVTSPESSSSAEGTRMQEGSVSAAAHSRHASTDSSSQQQQQQRQLSGRPSSMPDAVLVGPATSGIVVDELDALEDLLTDLDLLLPGGASETDSDMDSPVPVASQQQNVPPQPRQQL